MATPGLSPPSPGTHASAQQLQHARASVESPGERFRREILRRLDEFRQQGLDRSEAIRELFPRTVLPAGTYDDLITALVSGAHVLFFGPSGAGKTSLARDLWGIFPKEVWAIDGCPVLDHPLSVVDAAVAARYPPCPICERRFAPGGDPAQFRPAAVDPAKVPATYVTLREGFGYARLQGSSEVFPDHLTGNINLRKLEEVGDPMSPLVLEPGKLLQANRGFLLVDEIGKLPLGTQNVLLQALQEGTVTPAKSRESFPGLFVAVCTSNLSDLDNINDPLSDRLTSLHVGYNDRHTDNVRIVALARADEPTGYLPEILVDAGVRVIEAWRLRMSEDNPDIGEVGSNRTLIDVAQRTAATALLAGRPLATNADLRSGLVHAMRGRIRARSGDSFRQNERRVGEFIDQYLAPALKRSAGVYWCRFYRGVLHENGADAQALIGEGRRLKDDAEMRGQLAADGPLFPKFRPFVRYVADRERPPASLVPSDVAVHAFRLLEEHSLFTCTDEDDDDAPL
ncbi:MAG TPA: sigma 54-interacting transcriptional regulator [Thermoplasmata archaeon]|nr:sigma 54-interacting transcriptional regulator [Thermoplasmata archaeon]